jgi:hypothetical protein
MEARGFEPRSETRSTTAPESRVASDKSASGNGSLTTYCNLQNKTSAQ